MHWKSLEKKKVKRPIEPLNVSKEMMKEKGIAGHSFMHLHNYFTFYKILFWPKLQTEKRVQKVDYHSHQIARGAFGKLVIVITNVS